MRRTTSHTPRPISRSGQVNLKIWLPISSSWPSRKSSPRPMRTTAPIGSLRRHSAVGGGGPLGSTPGPARRKGGGGYGGWYAEPYGGGGYAPPGPAGAGPGLPGTPLPGGGPWGG